MATAPIIRTLAAAPDTGATIPALFIGHGNPMNAIEDTEFSRAWADAARSLPKPKAVLCISAHWETAGTRVTAMEQPKTIHDFYGFPRGFYRLIDARRATDWISLPPEAFVIFGIGLHRSLSEKFLQAMIKYEDCTTALCVREGRELSGEGVPLGHELLNVECGHPCHSWICGGAENDFVERKQLTLNQHGYIDKFETALQCTQVIERGEIPGEPGPWFPWLIVHYT